MDYRLIATALGSFGLGLGIMYSLCHSWTVQVVNEWKEKGYLKLPDD